MLLSVAPQRRCSSGILTWRTHTRGKVGWKGDVAVVRLHNTRMARLGWRARYNSAQAVRATVAALTTDPRFFAEPTKTRRRAAAK